MSAVNFKKFNKFSEKQIRNFHESLNEKDARRYAGTLCQILGYGGLEYICGLLNITGKTVRKGWRELLKETLPCEGRQRKVGGGRKAKWNDKDLNEAFRTAIEPFTAGDPMSEKIKWTNLSKHEISELLLVMGFKVSKGTIKRLLKNNGFKRRKIQKRKSLKAVEDRDKQFKKINRARKAFEKQGNPVVSIDTKKKENIGENHREGTCYATGQIDGPDHTYASLNTGKGAPHGIYDIKNKHAMINIGTSHETAAFVVDSLIYWWDTYGKITYPGATKILMLFDAGGANSYRHHVFKKELQRLANTIGITIFIKHYPSYTSKWNPIEHRVFPHVARMIKGVFIKSIDCLKKLIERAKTKTGLTVKANILNKEYKIGIKTKKEDLKNCKIKFDRAIPKWNYSVSPVF